MYSLINKMFLLLFFFSQGTPVLFAAHQNNHDGGEKQDMEVDLSEIIKKLHDKYVEINGLKKILSEQEDSFEKSRDTSIKLQDFFNPNTAVERKRKRESEDDDRKTKRQRCNELGAQFENSLQKCLTDANNVINAVNDASSYLMTGKAEYTSLLKNAQNILGGYAPLQATIIPEEPKSESSTSLATEQKHEISTLTSNSSSPDENVYTIELDKNLDRKGIIKFLKAQLEYAHKRDFDNVHVESAELVDTVLHDKDLPLKNFSTLSFKNFDKERLKPLFGEILGTTTSLSVEGDHIVESILKGSKCKWEELEVLTITETAFMSSNDIMNYIDNFKRRIGVKFFADKLISLTFNFTNLPDGDNEEIKSSAQKIAESRGLQSLLVTMKGEKFYEFKKPSKQIQSDSDE